MGNANEVVRGYADEQDRLAAWGASQKAGQEAATTAAAEAAKEAAKSASKSAEREAAEEARIECAEHLSRDFARVRARFGMDPALAQRSLDAAWTTDVIAEEDESEFVDTLADCVGVGLSLDSALTSWDMGTLAADETEEDEDPSPPLLMIASATKLRSGRRLYIR